jgi:EAL domain-containing protein (putative c-di-GMP-specific phosphodiesterase class I)
MAMSPSDIETSAPPSTGLAWRLHELLHGTSHSEGRRLSFLAIDPARKHFGTDWPRVSVKVHGIVGDTLRSFLSEGDIYAPADELSYIIMSSNKASDDFDKLMDDISAEISARLTGKGITRDLVCIVHLNAGSDTNQAHRPVPQELDATAHMSNIERIISKAEASAEEFDIKSISHDLLAVLQTDMMAASSSICQASRLDEDRIRRDGYAILPLQADPILYAELDALTVEFASKQLKDSMDRHLIIQIPVHRFTLSSKKYREMYLKICHGLLANRKERVIFDIHGIDEGTPSNRISEYMQWLRPYGRAIAITVDLDFSTISAFSGLNAASIGADLRTVGSDLAIHKAGKFINRVKTANLKSHIHGIVSKAQADLCLKLGADYLDGDLISEGLI